MHKILFFVALKQKKDEGATLSNPFDAVDLLALYP